MLRLFLVLVAVCLVTSLNVSVNPQQSAKVGDASVVLYCSYTNVPDDVTSEVVEWRKKSDGGAVLLASRFKTGLVQVNDQRFSIINEASLKISDVVAEDAGEYTCTARYAEGADRTESSGTTKLTVSVTSQDATAAAEPTNKPGDQSSTPGDASTLKYCTRLMFLLTFISLILSR
ncbi:protein sidekick-2-like [Ptychodera flava]|uniref:protein sidekick-2-like n=1 Tax=Ptychodera flava TaxID=63121 RepID=UPI00396A44FC